MSARKVNGSNSFPQAAYIQSRLSLAAKDVRIRKNGIEFKSNDAFQTWTEMTVAIEVPGDTRKVHCSGVVVECNGNRHTGYLVSLVFTHVTPKMQAALESISFRRTA